MLKPNQRWLKIAIMRGKMIILLKKLEITFMVITIGHIPSLDCVPAHIDQIWLSWYLIHLSILLCLLVILSDLHTHIYFLRTEVTIFGHSISTNLGWGTQGSLLFQ